MSTAFESSPATSALSEPGPVDRRAPATVRGRRHPGRGRRGWVVRRALLCADLTGILVAAAASLAILRVEPSPLEVTMFVVTLPLWALAAKLEGLYDGDEERTDHTTVDDLRGVLHVLTLGTLVLLAGSWALSAARLRPGRALLFWSLGLVVVVSGRAVARSVARRRDSYRQNTLVLGAGSVGQLVARKIQHHPEYGLRLVGFVDASPRERREEVRDVPVLGGMDALADLVRVHDVARVIVAFSRDTSQASLEQVRTLRDLGVQVDIVPRLFEAVGPNVEVHTLEGLPLVGLPPSRLSRSSALVKRALDVAGALAGLVVLAPFLLLIALLVRLDSPGPVLFRQRRLAEGMREFTVLKFRTMRVGTDESLHRRYIEGIAGDAAPEAGNGLYKLARELDVTRMGRFLRRTSLDELPQLLNVLRGEMSLVGPRPCIPYEVEVFAPHHFERFLVPAGITGLWQVTARAQTTFTEALDMDVAYVRGWSLSLDLSLLARTAGRVLSRSGAA